jgi:predicted solute-binding protein
VLRSSIEWALSHRDETMRALLNDENRLGLVLDRAKLDRYLAMYANADTLDAPADVREAVAQLYARGAAARLLPRLVQPEFAP